MHDFRNEIPQRAFINAQVIQDAITSGDLERVLAKWATHYGMPNYTLLNPAHVASLLYCLIVVPKEIWNPPSNDNVFKQMERTGAMALFTIKQWKPPANENHLRDFLRHLRNAISHAKFSVDENQGFEFWDESNGSETYRVVISLNNLSVFLSRVGALLANMRSR